MWEDSGQILEGWMVMELYANTDRDPITNNKLKDAHRRLMLANHPDRGGSPYIAGKVNEARVLLE